LYEIFKLADMQNWHQIN